MDKIKDRLKQEWEERPIIIIMAASAVAQATLSAVKVVNETRNANAWKKEVNRRDRMTR